MNRTTKTTEKEIFNLCAQYSISAYNRSSLIQDFRFNPGNHESQGDALTLMLFCMYHRPNDFNRDFFEYFPNEITWRNEDFDPFFNHGGRIERITIVYSEILQDENHGAYDATIIIHLNANSPINAFSDNDEHWQKIFLEELSTDAGYDYMVCGVETNKIILSESY